MSQLRYREAVRAAMIEEMERDERVYLVGEEVGHYQGAYKVSEGMLERFGPKRVIDAPITESGFTGISIGAAMVGNFPTNGVLETQIQLQPNKCYTIVATSLPPVSEVNVQIVAVAPLPGLAPVLATDMDTGPNAVLGRKPNCYKWALPLPAPAKVVLQVTAGSGLVAAQLYEK